MAETHYGKFSKDGETEVATSQERAVLLRFNGWTEEKPATPAAARAIKEATASDSK